MNYKPSDGDCCSPNEANIMSVTNFYSYIWSLRDPRTEGWGLTADAKFVFPVLALYLYVVKVAGPRFMKHRKPYQLKPAILAYNLFMVAANLYFFWNYLRRSYAGGGYNIFCQVNFLHFENLDISLATQWQIIFSLYFTSLYRSTW